MKPWFENEMDISVKSSSVFTPLRNTNTESHREFYPYQA